MPSTYCVSVRGNYIGKVYCTLADLVAALGPYVTVVGNHVNVWGAP